MPRPVRRRTIEMPPGMMGYRPFGMVRCKNGSVKLKYEEFESIRLIGYLILSQEDASKQMRVSRPTFTRIYNKALRTVAKAFAEGKCIEIEGGDYSTENEWFRCKRCRKVTEGKEKHFECKWCNRVNSDDQVKVASTGKPEEQTN